MPLLPPRIGHIQPGELCFLLVKLRRADPMAPAYFRRRDATLLFSQNRDDLFFCETACAHRPSPR